jgi:hypothetical protein
MSWTGLNLRRRVRTRLAYAIDRLIVRLDPGSERLTPDDVGAIEPDPRLGAPAPTPPTAAPPAAAPPTAPSAAPEAIPSERSAPPPNQGPPNHPPTPAPVAAVEPAAEPATAEPAAAAPASQPTPPASRSKRGRKAAAADAQPPAEAPPVAPPPLPPLPQPPPVAPRRPDTVDAAEKQRRHWERTRRGVLRFVAERGGSASLKELHDHAESTYFVAHVSFSRLMEELTGEALLGYDHATATATLTDAGRAIVDG